MFAICALLAQMLPSRPKPHQQMFRNPICIWFIFAGKEAPDAYADAFADALVKHGYYSEGVTSAQLNVPYPRPKSVKRVFLDLGLNVPTAVVSAQSRGDGAICRKIMVHTMQTDD